MLLVKERMKDLFQKCKNFWSKLYSCLKKHKLISFVIVFFVILIFFLLKLFLENSNYLNKKRIFVGEKIYNQVHNLYFYGDGFEYDIQVEDGIIVVDETNTEYYKLKSLNYIQNNFTQNEMDDIKKQFDLININDSYYIKNFGRGISGYFGTTLTVDKVSNKKIEFVAHSKFCEIDARVYDTCKGEEYMYTIDKPFTLVKENGIWKVDEYTSVFEFKDSEYK